MTVKPLGNGRYTGLSTDTKPTPANTAVDAIFEETDTGNAFTNTGTAWTILRVPPTNIGPERWYIYRTGTATRSEPSPSRPVPTRSHT